MKCAIIAKNPAYLREAETILLLKSMLLEISNIMDSNYTTAGKVVMANQVLDQFNYKYPDIDKEELRREVYGY